MLLFVNNWMQVDTARAAKRLDLSEYGGIGTMEVIFSKALGFCFPVNLNFFFLVIRY